MRNKQALIILLLTSILIVACTCNFSKYLQNEGVQEPTSLLLDETATVTPYPTPENPLADESELQTEEAAEQAAANISMKHQLLIEGQSVYLIDDQGENLRTLISGQYISQISTAPNGSRIAFIQAEYETMEGILTLKVMNLATGEMEAELPLTSAQSVFYSTEEAAWEDPSRDANMAMIWDNLVWSPDGKSLAFVGAPQGAWANLYVYDTESRSFLHLAGGESHNYRPVWSPDSRYILSPSAYSFGTGAGYSMDAMWVAARDGSMSRKLYDASTYIDETVLGWSDNFHALVASSDFMAGFKYLRLVNIENGEMQVITTTSDYFNNAVVSPQSQTVVFLFTYSDLLDYIEGETIIEDGLYRYHIADGLLEILSYDVSRFGSDLMLHDESDCVYYTGSFDIDGEVSFVHSYPAGWAPEDSCQWFPEGVTELPSFSPSEKYYSWIQVNWQEPAQSQLWLGDSQSKETRIIQLGIVAAGLWHPEDDVLYFYRDTELFWASAPDFTPELIENLADSASGLMWIAP